MLPPWAGRRWGGGYWVCPASLHNSCHCLRQRLKHLPSHVCRQLLQASASSWLACMGRRACLRAWRSSGHQIQLCPHEHGAVQALSMQQWVLWQQTLT